jgi:hypothetical protein
MTSAGGVYEGVDLIVFILIDLIEKGGQSSPVSYVESVPLDSRVYDALEVRQGVPDLLQFGNNLIKPALAIAGDESKPLTHAHQLNRQLASNATGRTGEEQVLATHPLLCAIMLKGVRMCHIVTS